MTIIYQSWGEPRHLKQIDSSAIAIQYKTNHASNFELDLFKSIFARHRAEAIPQPWGLLSWKFAAKTDLSVTDFTQFSNRALAEGADCVFINPYFDAQALYFNVWEQGALIHGDSFERLFNWCIQQGLFHSHAIMGIAHFALSNYFVATHAFWTAYLEFVELVLHRMQHDANTEIRMLACSPGGYDLKPEAHMRVFIIERLFSQFIAQSSNWRCVPYRQDLSWCETKYGEQFGPLFFQLSELKNAAIAHHDVDLLNQWQSLRQELNQLIFSRSS